MRFGTQTFFDALNENGFNEILNTPLGLPSRRPLLLGLMASSQDMLSPLSASEASTILSPVIIGQAHDNKMDFRYAKSYLTAENKNGTLLLESDGDLHPLSGPKDLVEAAKESGAVVITEHELYNAHDAAAVPDPTKDGLVKRHHPPLSRSERSWLVGMYTANSIASKPQTNHLLVFGDEHINEIKESTNTVLKYMGKDPVEFNDIPTRGHRADEDESEATQAELEQIKANRVSEHFDLNEFIKARHGFFNLKAQIPKEIAEIEKLKKKSTEGNSGPASTAAAVNLSASLNYIATTLSLDINRLREEAFKENVASFLKNGGTRDGLDCIIASCDYEKKDSDKIDKFMFLIECCLNTDLSHDSIEAIVDEIDNTQAPNSFGLN